MMVCTRTGESDQCGPTDLRPSADGHEAEAGIKPLDHRSEEDSGGQTCCCRGDASVREKSNLRGADPTGIRGSSSAVV